MSWTFSDNVPPERRERLLSSPRYDEIVKVMASEACRMTLCIECGNSDGDRPDLTDCHRPSFLFCVTRDTGDLFFNSPQGYRAAYCENSANGARANRLVIQALTPRLLDAWDEHNSPDFDAKWVTKSLAHDSAKVWVDELCLGVGRWIDLKIEINNPVWVEAAAVHKQGIDTSVLEGELSYRGERYEARLAYWGVRAPLCEWFEVKGAWMNPNLNFRIGKPPDKRANDICKQGWS